MKTKEHKRKCPRCNRELEPNEELDCGPDPYSSAVLGDFSDYFSWTMAGLHNGRSRQKILRKSKK